MAEERVASHVPVAILCHKKAVNCTKNSAGTVKTAQHLFLCKLKRESSWLRHRIKQGGEDPEDAHIAGKLHAMGKPGVSLLTLEGDER